LYFVKDELSTGGSESRKQLNCIGGKAEKYSELVHTVKCKNIGKTSNSIIKWECDTDISNKYQLYDMTVNCEGYYGKNDKRYIKKNSCFLEYKMGFTYPDNVVHKNHEMYLSFLNDDPLIRWKDGTVSRSMIVQDMPYDMSNWELPYSFWCERDKNYEWKCEYKMVQENNNYYLKSYNVQCDKFEQDSNYYYRDSCYITYSIGKKTKNIMIELLRYLVPVFIGAIIIVSFGFHFLLVIPDIVFYSGYLCCFTPRT
jgi:hypothetical protein